MGYITIDELSAALKAYLESLGLSEEEVNEIVNNALVSINEKNEGQDDAIEGLETKIGELSGLATQEKSSIVAAINELFQNANNGKELIANAIGEPVSADDTFQAMSNDINGLLSTFKTNMMNNGVTVEAGDRFKALIDKIAAMVDSEGKGIQIVEGALANITTSTSFEETGDYLRINFDKTLPFTPTYLIAGNFTLQSSGTTLYMVGQLSNVYSTGSTNRSLKIENITTTSFDITYTTTGTSSNFSIVHGYNLTYIAIGVGEEDTTLRDSLAAVLQEEGVTVTDEDDMASLITKTDVEFNDKNNEMNSRKQGLVDTLLNKSINANNTMTWEELYAIVSLSCNSVMTDVASLHCGGNQTVIIKNDGTVWGTGANTMGQLGFGNTTNIEYFKQMNITDIKQLEHGYGSIMIIKNDGTVWACGNNSNGQLGLGLDITLNTVPPVTTFGKLTGTANVISLGNIHSMLVHNGELYYAGNGSMGQFGTGGQHGSYNTFQKNTVVSNVEKVFCGVQNTIILKSDGTIMGCGNNVQYELGLTGQQILKFTTIDTDVIDVIMNCNTNNTMYIKADNTLWGMGKNNNGILGLGNTTIQQTKVKLADNVRLAALGANHSIIVKYDGTVWVSGSNTYGQLGLGDNTQRTKFTQLTGIDGNLIKQVGCNQTATHILLNNGILLNCGQNNYGQLGKDCRKFAGV